MVVERKVGNHPFTLLKEGSHELWIPGPWGENDIQRPSGRAQSCWGLVRCQLGPVDHGCFRASAGVRSEDRSTNSLCITRIIHIQTPRNGPKPRYSQSALRPPGEAGWQRNSPLKCHVLWELGCGSLCSKPKCLNGVRGAHLGFTAHCKTSNELA